ncbi:coaE [Symbiodinium microadriaticum]|nr:coaE [Symbiodinium microadriaticum]
MGKSETAKMFAAEGVPVYDADAAVHKLYEKGGAAVEPIGKAFPNAIVDGAVDRTKLSAEVVDNKERLKELESIIHPLVGLEQLTFLQDADNAGAPMVVLDIPLIYETGGEARVDVVVVVSAPADLQRERVLARPGMTVDKFESILAKQVPDEEKRKRADFIIESDKGLEHAHNQAGQVMVAAREVVLDTETTGLSPDDGHRIVEIGALELINHVPTGKTCHIYINPERDMPEEAFGVHGLSEEFLADKPKFAEIAQEFLDFIADDQLIIHNAAFDLKFLNAELKWAKQPVIDEGRAIDTLMIARRKFPGSPASLDALCKRFGIDNSDRTLHGALLDSELLADVYIELIDARQAVLLGGTDGGQVASGSARKRDHKAAKTLSKRWAMMKTIRRYGPNWRDKAMTEKATLTPYICTDNCAEAIAFYKQAFGAKEIGTRYTAPDGTIGHAELSILGNHIMISDEAPDFGAVAPKTLGGSPLLFYMHVPALDPIWAQAIAAGAEELRPVEIQPHGDRSGVLLDPYGFRWMIAETASEPTREEIQDKMDGAFELSES